MARNRRHVVLFVVVSILCGLPAHPVETGLRALIPGGPAADPGATPDLQIEAPEPTYPVQAVEQLPFRGARHGLVTTTTGALVFRAIDLRLPGRMPIEFGRVYDSSISTFLPPPPPGQSTEPRWTDDLGKCWILGYDTYLWPVAGGVLMATADGDVIEWDEEPDGSFERVQDVPTRHMKLERQSSTVIKETLLDGNVWTYTKINTPTGHTYLLTRMEDRSGNSITLTYSGSYLSRVENSDGAWIDVLRPAFDPNYPSTVFPSSRVVRLTDSTGRIVSFDYNSLGLLTKVTDVLGKDWTFTYAANDKLATATDPLGNVYLNATWDADNRVATYEANDGPWSFAYPGGQSVTQVTDAFGEMWRYSKDPVNGITIELLEPEMGEYTFSVNAANNPTTFMGPAGWSESWTYDSDHRPLTHRPMGPGTPAVTYSYDANGAVSTITALDGGVTTLSRDGAGRILEELDAEGGRWTATYATNGDRLTLRLPKGNVSGGSGFEWSFQRDGFGQVTQTTDPSGRLYFREYTSRGDLAKVRRPDRLDAQTGQTIYAEWIYGRDSLGRPTSVTHPLGNAWTRTWDDAGRLIRIEGPAGTVRRFEYDARHRLRKSIVQKAVGEDLVTELTYDAGGRVATKIAPGGGVWTYGYDDSGRRTSIEDPLGRTWTFGRDLAGRIVSTTYPGGRTVTTVRDDIGRIVSRSFPGGREEIFAYTDGRMTSAEATEAGRTARVDWIFDRLGRATQVETLHTSSLSANSRILELTYDVNGNRTRLFDQQGIEILYTYDGLDRLTQAAGSSYGTWAVTYHPQSGERSRVTLSSGSTLSKWEEWDFDTAARPTGHRWGTTAATTLGDLAWTLDAEGRSLLETNAVDGTTRAAGFDGAGHLVSLTTTSGGTETVESFDFDADGNVVETTVADGVTDPVVTTLTRDLLGRVVFGRRGDHTRTYTWEDTPEDPAVAFKLWRGPNDSEEWAVEADYGYDGRISRVRGLHRDSSDSTSLAEYFWSPLADGSLFRATESLADGSLSVRNMSFEVAGYYAEQTTTGSLQRLVSSVEAVDAALAGMLPGLSSGVPAPEVPFRLGRESGADSRIILDGGAALTGRASGLSEAWTERPGSLDAARLPVTISVLQPVRTAMPDLEDDWARGRTYLESNAPIARASFAMEAGTSPPEGSSGGSVGSTSIVDERVPRGNDGDWWVTVSTCEGMIVDFGPPMAPCRSMLIDIRRYSSAPASTIDCSWPQYGARAVESSRYPDVSEGGVELRNGSFRTEVVDLSLYDPAGPISFARTYLSNVDRKGEFGWRWFHNFEERIERRINSSCSEQVRWTSPMGVQAVFFRDTEAPYGWMSPPDATVRIRELADPNIKWQLRDLHGVIREFDWQGRLLRVYGTGPSYELIRTDVDPDPSPSAVVTRLTRIQTSDGHGIDLAYGNVHGDWLIESATAAGQTVEYQYSSCDEIATVSEPARELGYGKEGQALGLATPQTRYTYFNSATVGASCPGVGGADSHKLKTVAVAQLDPLRGDTQSVFETVLINNYFAPPQGAALFEYQRVIGQCFGKPSCAPGVEDLSYSVTKSEATGARYPWSASIVDHRLGTGQEVEERHDYDASSGHLVAVVEDAVGLGRTTSFSYNNDLLTRTNFPDGTCAEAKFVNAGGVLVVREERRRTKAKCENPQATPEGDRVIRYTYDDVSGKVRTVTGPEAFQDGIVPLVFDPNVAPHKFFTTFYEYDLNQTSYASNPGLKTLADDWDLPYPDVVGDVNNDDADDLEFYGHLIRTYRYAPDGTTILASTRRSQPNGRPLWVKGPDAVRTEYSYYESVDRGLWDWRVTGASSASETGAGPLATKTVVPVGWTPQTPGTDPQPLKTLFAWDSLGRQVASQGPDGVRAERRLDASGRTIEERLCSPTLGTEPNCADFSATDWVLRYTRSTTDLRGRPIRSAVHDPNKTNHATSPIAATWTTFDVLGRPTSTTVDPDPSATPGGSDPDPNGGPLHIVSRVCYDGQGRTKRTISPEGRVACMTFDALGRATSSAAYDTLNAGNPACAAVENTCPGPLAGDVTVSTVFDAMDRPWKSVDGAGVATYSWNDEYGRPKFVSDGKPVGATEPAPLNSQTFPAPPAATWYAETGYDFAGRPIRTGLRGRHGDGSTAWLAAGWSEYDTLGRATASVVAIDASGKVPDSIAELPVAPPDNPNGTRIARSTTHHDNAGRVDQVTDAGGRVTNTEYDSLGRVTRTLGPAMGGNRDTVESAFDEFGRQNSVAQTNFGPGGATLTQSATTSYDQWGRVERTTGDPSPDPALGANLITTTTYDALSRAIETITRWNVASSYPSLDPNDRVVTRDYDSAGRLWRTRQRVATSPETWAETQLAYDLDGLTTRLTDAQGNQSDWVYKDASGTGGLGRILKMQYPLTGGKRQTTAITQYDGVGRPITIQHREDDNDSASRVSWSQEYDSRGRLKRKSSSFANIGTVEFAGSRQQFFDYDDANRTVRATDRTDATNASPTPTPADIVVEFAYDTAGRALEENQRIGLNGSLVDHWVNSTWSIDGFRTKLEYPESAGRPVRYSLTMSPDTLGRLATINGPAGPQESVTDISRQLASWQWIGARPWIRSSGSGTETRYFEGSTPLYDGLGRLRGMATVNSSNGATIADLRYGFDRVGNLTYEQRRHECIGADCATLPLPQRTFRTRAYKTDLMGRLARWREGGLLADSPSIPAIAPADSDPSDNPASQNAGEAWTLDLVGNWTQKKTGTTTETTDLYQPNSLNQYLHVDPDEDQQQRKLFSIDWLGQMRRDETSNKTFVWDAFGRLSRVKNLDGTSVIAVSRYDAFNRRVEKEDLTSVVARDAKTRFVYDGWRAVEERAVTGTAPNETETVRARYGFGVALDEVLWMDRDVARLNGAPDPIQGTPDGSIEARYFFAQDALGSTVATTSDPTTTQQPLDVIERYTYAAYGAVSVRRDDWSPAVGAYSTPAEGVSRVGMPYLFTGQRLDPETGYAYFKNRYYDLEGGRFLRRDLIGYKDGPNVYAYAQSAAHLVTDSLGLMSEENHRATLWAASRIAGAPSWLFDWMWAYERDMDLNLDYTVWWHGPNLWELGWLRNAEYHGFDVTVTEESFQSDLDAADSMRDLAALGHLVTDDGFLEDGVHGGYSKWFGHAGADAALKYFTRDLGASFDNPSRKQLNDAAARKARMIREAMARLKVDGESRWRFGLLASGADDADEVVNVTATIIQITDQSTLLSTLDALWAARMQKDGLSALEYSVGVQAAWNEYLQLRQFSDAPGAKRFGSPSMIGSQGLLGQRANGGSLSLSRGGVRQDDPLTGGASGQAPPKTKQEMMESESQW